VLAGLVPWTLFAQSLNGAGNSVVANSGMLSKVYFPRLLFPLAAVGAFVVDFVIGLVVLAAFALAFGFVPTPAWLLLLPLGLVAVLVSLAIGVWIAALNVRYRDFRHALPFLTQLWFFATPIAYGSAAVPESLRGLVILNPMSGVVEAFRWVIIGTGDRPVALLLASVGISLVVLASGIVYFRRAERTFADVA
jgi:lipopolysaccharide transport system permease protein